jgi:hypothetical protein
MSIDTAKSRRQSRCPLSRLSGLCPSQVLGRIALREPTGLHERPTDLNHGDTDNSSVGEIKASLTLFPLPPLTPTISVLSVAPIDGAGGWIW